jgi:probable phosphoglycerate mutase
MKNNFCTIYLVRHGRTDWNEKGLIQGHTNIALNQEGKIQAENLARELKHIKFDKVFSSDLARAKQTAEIIALEHKLSVETSKALRERNFGKYEGKHWTVLEEINEVLKKLDEKARFSYKHHPSVESDEEVIDRFATLLKEIAVSNPGKNILVVTHGGTMRAFLVLLGKIDSKHFFIEIANMAFVEVVSDGVDFIIKKTNGIENKEREN